MSHYDIAFHYLMLAEGGYLESDSEHGGAAMRGVSLDLFRKWRKDETLTMADLRNHPIEETKEIMRWRFWDRMDGDKIQGRLTAIALLNQSVHRGITGLKDGMISMFGTKRFGGVKFETRPEFSELTARFNQMDDTWLFIEICCNAQHAYLQMAMRNPDKFLKQQPGWTNRVYNMLRLLGEKK